MVEEKPKENIARAIGINRIISSKDAIEIANFIRYRDLGKAKKLLENVIIKKVAVPMRRFNKDTGHRPGIGPGRYPLKAAQEFLSLLLSAEANAKFKNIDTEKLYLYKVIANKGARSYRTGRMRRRLGKSTNLEIVLKVKGDKK